MIEAIPIDTNGDYIGSYQEFPNEQWESMKRSFGKHLRWKLVKDIEEEPEISPDESEKIFGKTQEEIIFDKEELEEYTKRELIEKYGLSEDLMKLTKAKIIEIISSI